MIVTVYSRNGFVCLLFRVGMGLLLFRVGM